jgi:hypothetical protein
VWSGQQQGLPFSEPSVTTPLTHNVMYWSKQEQFAFDIILLLLVGFKFATVSLYAQNSLNNGILVVAINVSLLLL